MLFRHSNPINPQVTPEHLQLGEKENALSLRPIPLGELKDSEGLREVINWILLMPTLQMSIQERLDPSKSGFKGSVDST